MEVTRIRGLLFISVVTLLLAGCASNEPEDELFVDDTPSVDTSKPKVTPPSVPERRRPTVDRNNRLTIFGRGDRSGETLQGLFYFDFDQAIVKRTGHRELDKHSKALKEERSLRIRLEGHADERGTREYNLALGEKRANAIRAYLAAQGVSRSQIEVISYGEEKSAARGSNERSWALNRRVEFKYR